MKITVKKVRPLLSPVMILWFLLFRVKLIWQLAVLRKPSGRRKLLAGVLKTILLRRVNLALVKLLLLRGRFSVPRIKMRLTFRQLSGRLVQTRV